MLIRSTGNWKMPSSSNSMLMQPQIALSSSATGTGHNQACLKSMPLIGRSLAILALKPNVQYTILYSYVQHQMYSATSNIPAPCLVIPDISCFTIGGAEPHQNMMRRKQSCSSSDFLFIYCSKIFWNKNITNCIYDDELKGEMLNWIRKQTSPYKMKVYNTFNI